MNPLQSQNDNCHHIVTGVMASFGKKLLSFSLKFGVTASILYYLSVNGQLELARLAFYFDKPGALLRVTFILAVLIPVIMALRWKLLVNVLGIPLSFQSAFFLTWIGNFFNSTLPGSLTGDVVKGLFIRKRFPGSSKSAVLMSLLIDRLTGLFGLIVISFLALPFNFSWLLETPKAQPVAFFVGVLALGTLVFYALIFVPFSPEKDPFQRLIARLPLGEKLGKIYRAFKSYQHHKEALFWSLSLAILNHILLAHIFAFLAGLLERAPSHIMQQLLIMPVGLITIAIPVSPGGIGLGHAAFETLFKLINNNEGANIFNLYVVVQFVVNLAGGVLYLLYRSHGEESIVDEVEPSGE